MRDDLAHYDTAFLARVKHQHDLSDSLAIQGQDHCGVLPGVTNDRDWAPSLLSLVTQIPPNNVHRCQPPSFGCWLFLPLPGNGISIGACRWIGNNLL